MEWSDPVARCMFVKSEARRALTVVAHSRSDVEDAIRSDAYRTDSPIEAQFATWFSAARGHQLSLGNARFALQLRPQTWVECEGGGLVTGWTSSWSRWTSGFELRCVARGFRSG